MRPSSSSVSPSPTSPSPSPRSAWRATIVVVVATLLGSIACDRHLGEPRPGRAAVPTDDDDPTTTMFSDARARAVAAALESGGARVTGSAAEAHAFAYLHAEARAVQRAANARAFVDVDVVLDRASSRDAIVGGSWTTAYRNLTTLAVRARARRAIERAYAERAVLISAHVDTVHSSAGGSDNGANCALALETFRAFVARASDDAMCDDARKTCAVVIVLFLTAEEDGLVGAYGATRRRDWFGASATTPIQVILNLESIGAGGPHRMFQAKTTTRVGREAIETWARVAPRARGDALAEDIFNSGVVNSGTDYAVYRDYAPNVPAMFDFAFAERTMVYHTPRDRVKYIRAGTLKRAGDNLLAFVSEFASDGGFADDEVDEVDDDKVRAKKPRVSWYTIPGYGMVVHDAPNVDASASFVVAPLVALSAFLHKVFIGDFVVSPRNTIAPDTVKDRVEHTVRLMVTIPFVASACAACWVVAAASAAFSTAALARAFDAPHLFVAHPFALVALAGGTSVAAFVATTRIACTVTHALLPLAVKMRPTPCASRAVEFSMLLGHVVVWGALACKAVRAHLGSSSLVAMWFTLPALTAVAPAVAPFLLASRRGCPATPRPPSAARLALAFAAPLWITAPNVSTLVALLSGVGARAPVPEDMRYAYDAIVAAVVGVAFAAPTSYVASAAASRNSHGAWRVMCACGVIASAASIARMAFVMRGDRAASGAPWSALAPQPVILTHLTTARAGTTTSSVLALARVGSGSVVNVARALNADESINTTYAFSCDVTNATVDFADVAMRVKGGAACVGRALAGEFALADEVTQHASGATAPAFTNVTRTPSVVSALMHVGTSARWILAVDKRCVAKLWAASKASGADESAAWINVGNYTRGRGSRFSMNGVRGGGDPWAPYAVKFEPRTREERETYFKNKNAEIEACGDAARVRLDYVARTPAIVRVDKGLPKFAVPFGKHKSPQWLAFVDSLEV